MGLFKSHPFGQHLLRARQVVPCTAVRTAAPPEVGARVQSGSHGGASASAAVRRQLFQPWCPAGSCHPGPARQGVSVPLQTGPWSPPIALLNPLPPCGRCGSSLSANTQFCPKDSPPSSTPPQGAQADPLMSAGFVFLLPSLPTTDIFRFGGEMSGHCKPFLYWQH